MEYPEEFGKRMELVQSMMELARMHRLSDASEHPALAKMREDLVRLADKEEEDQIWNQNKNIDLFDEEDDEDWPKHWNTESDLDHDEL